MDFYAFIVFSNELLMSLNWYIIKYWATYRGFQITVINDFEKLFKYIKINIIFINYYNII